jgi:hypothetical protein
VMDVLKRIDYRLQGRSLLSLPEQLLSDARDEIVKLRDENKKLLKAIQDLKEQSETIS